MNDVMRTDRCTEIVFATAALALGTLLWSGCSSSGAPASSSCLAGSAHFVVDPKDNICKLDGTTTNVGAPCSGTSPATCGTDQNASCLDEVIDEFPGGYCNVDPCSTAIGHLCPLGSSCVQLNGENGQCFKDCAMDADCRKAEGYFCLDMTGDDHAGGLWQSGASHKVCSRNTLTCPSAPGNCPTVLPRCVFPDGSRAYSDAGTLNIDGADGGAPPTPVCVK